MKDVYRMFKVIFWMLGTVFWVFSLTNVILAINGRELGIPVNIHKRRMRSPDPKIENIKIQNIGYFSWALFNLLLFIYISYYFFEHYDKNKTGNLIVIEALENEIWLHVVQINGIEDMLYIIN